MSEHPDIFAKGVAYEENSGNVSGLAGSDGFVGALLR